MNSDADSGPRPAPYDRASRASAVKIDRPRHLCADRRRQIRETFPSKKPLRRRIPVGLRPPWAAVVAYCWMVTRNAGSQVMNEGRRLPIRRTSSKRLFGAHQYGINKKKGGEREQIFMLSEEARPPPSPRRCANVAVPSKMNQRRRRPLNDHHIPRPESASSLSAKSGGNCRLQSIAQR